MVFKHLQNDSKPYLVAITGSFAVGKSLVGDILKELGYKVIDTDDIVADLLSSKNKITSKIVKEFGKEILKGKHIDKKHLASLVFNDKLKRKKLESIIHPEVRKIIFEKINKERGQEIVYVLVPLLFESGFDKDYDEIWCIVCNSKIQMKRAKLKGFSKKDALLRIGAQFAQKEKARHSDYVINNSGSVLETKKQILNRLKQLNPTKH